MKDLIIISDVHIAHSWDKIVQIIPENYNFLNPNKWFKKVVNSVRGDQILVVNGDLLDYYFADYEKQTESNWDLFWKILENCKGKTYCNLGNHDYRKMPYNYSIYGLKHVNIADKIRQNYKREIGNNKFRFFKELESVSVNLTAFNPLQKYRYKQDYCVENENTELIFLDTGPDAGFCRHYSNIIKELVLKIDISSRGLLSTQLRFLESRLKDSSKADIFIFIHCPIFWFLKNRSKFKYQNSRFRYLLSGNLLGARFIENNENFVSLLCQSTKNIFLITSHTHMANQFLMDKNSKYVMESNAEEINFKRKNSDLIKIISTLPLGAIRKEKGKRGKQIGYLKITSKQIDYEILKDFYV